MYDGEVSYYGVMVLGFLYLLSLNWWPLILLFRVRQLYSGLFNEGKFTGITASGRILRESKIVMWLM